MHFGKNFDSDMTAAYSPFSQRLTSMEMHWTTDAQNVKEWVPLHMAWNAIEMQGYSLHAGSTAYSRACYCLSPKSWAIWAFSRSAIRDSLAFNAISQFCSFRLLLLSWEGSWVFFPCILATKISRVIRFLAPKDMNAILSLENLIFTGMLQSFWF